MEKVKESFQINIFLLTSLLFIAAGGIILLMGDKVAIHVAINGVHTAFLDAFFTYWTHVGDGVFTSIAAILIVLLVFKKYRYSTLAFGAISLILCGVFSQFMKRAIFPDASRPVKYIGENILYLVPDVDVHMSNSFPSGHTTAAFTFFAFVSLALFRDNKLMQFLMALFAVLVGYSRMYLSQHFLEDVVTGAVLGIFTYFVTYWIVSLLPFKNGIIHGKNS